MGLLLVWLSPARAAGRKHSTRLKRFSVRKWDIRQRPLARAKSTLSRAALRCERPSAKVEVCNITQLPQALLAEESSISSEVRKCTFTEKCAGSVM